MRMSKDSGTNSSPRSSRSGAYLQGFHAIQRYGNDAGQRGNAAHHFDVRVQHEARNHEQQAFDQIHIAAQVQQPRREEHAERRHLEHQLVDCGQRGEGTLQIGVAGAAGFDGLVHRPVGAVPTRTPSPRPYPEHIPKPPPPASTAPPGIPGRASCPSAAWPRIRTGTPRAPPP